MYVCMYVCMYVGSFHGIPKEKWESQIPIADTDLYSTPYDTDSVISANELDNHDVLCSVVYSDIFAE